MVSLKIVLCVFGLAAGSAAEAPSPPDGMMPGMPNMQGMPQRAPAHGPFAPLPSSAHSLPFAPLPSARDHSRSPFFQTLR